MSKLTPLSVADLGGYLREQRQHAQLSLRQLADAAGISNPYLSQVERGLKKPSAEILQALARGLRISAESLYVRAGLLDEHADVDVRGLDVRAAVQADPRLTDRQRSALLDVYDSFVGQDGPSLRLVPPTPDDATAATDATDALGADATTDTANTAGESSTAAGATPRTRRRTGPATTRPRPPKTAPRSAPEPPPTSATRTRSPLDSETSRKQGD